MEHYRKLERMYLAANMNTQLYETTEIRIDDEVAEIKLTIDPKYFHALGAIHGSVYFKLLDDAAFFAVSSIIKDAFVLTTSYNINITRPVSKGVITAIGKLKFKSRNLFVAESSLVDEKGREIAFGTGNFAKSKIPLTEEIGYK
ncbi:PaaI family thioesterase [Kordia sp. YSTF-M3]|uniref:PaaI family thioesterase n=1 Tax=Kordia aestuariivivens TaxID=2759037 RepID=A0ABR7QA68_9FLAO|nr:PaaI family thioesterase [Kordia aestuariivivens]MBC8755224.1 PaaI family thioesterase [Kordia aestuariivivens]